MNIELIGYAATVFVLLSFLASDIRKLRVINILGGISWMWYGYLADSKSVLIGNFLVVTIHLYKLNKEIEQ